MAISQHLVAFATFIALVACGLVEENLDLSSVSLNKHHIMKRWVKNYIVQLSVLCPDASMGLGKITLTSDIPAIAIAECLNGNQKFTGILPTQTLTISAKPNQKKGEQICVMWQHSTSSESFSVRVRVGTGSNKTELFFAPEERNILCLFDNHGHATGNISNVLDGFMRPKDQIKYSGTHMNNKLDMFMVNVLDEKVTNSIHMGRLVRLKATASSSAGETLFIYAISCVAMNEKGVAYYIIRGSCGDGIVFPKHVGFTTYGNYTTSPYFKLFALAGSRKISFRCLFGRCNEKECDKMNSCPYFKEPGTTGPPTTPIRKEVTEKPKKNYSPPKKVTPPKLVTPKQTTAELITPKQTTAELITPKQTTAELITPKQTTAELITPKQTTAEFVTPKLPTPKLPLPEIVEEVNPKFPGPAAVNIEPTVPPRLPKPAKAVRPKLRKQPKPPKAVRPKLRKQPKLAKPSEPKLAKPSEPEFFGPDFIPKPKHDAAT